MLPNNMPEFLKALIGKAVKEGTVVAGSIPLHGKGCGCETENADMVIVGHVTEEDSLRRAELKNITKEMEATIAKLEMLKSQHDFTKKRLWYNIAERIGMGHETSAQFDDVGNILVSREDAQAIGLLYEEPEKKDTSVEE